MEISVFYLVPKHFHCPNWVKSIADDPALGLTSMCVVYWILKSIRNSERKWYTRHTRFCNEICGRLEFVCIYVPHCIKKLTDLKSSPDLVIWMGYEKVFPFWLESPLECTYVTDCWRQHKPFYCRFMVSIGLILCYLIHLGSSYLAVTLTVSVVL